MFLSAPARLMVSILRKSTTIIRFSSRPCILNGFECILPAKCRWWYSGQQQKHTRCSLVQSSRDAATMLKNILISGINCLIDSVSGVSSIAYNSKIFSSTLFGRVPRFFTLAYCEIQKGSKPWKFFSEKISNISYVFHFILYETIVTFTLWLILIK